MKTAASFCASSGLFVVILVLLTCSTQARLFDRFFSSDVCFNEADGTYGVCDHTKFPTCQEGKELICYNRRPFRNRFYEDTRQPFFYIDYKSVFCYPNTWAGCSSCTPGRYCASEQRCILQDRDYPCAQWI